MSRLSPRFIEEVLKQESGEAFLTLLTLDHPSWDEPIRLVNNTEDVISRGQVFQWYPFSLVLPQEDGETAREAQIVMDNTVQDLIIRLRSITDEVRVKLELVLSSIPNDVQMVLEDLVARNITYNLSTITAKLSMDNFLQTELTSERYTPAKYPGIF